MEFLLTKEYNTDKK